MKKVFLYSLLVVATACCNYIYEPLVIPMVKVKFTPDALYFGAQGGTDSIRASEAVWSFDNSMMIDTQTYYIYDSRYCPTYYEHRKYCIDSVWTDIDTLARLRILYLEHSWFSVRRITESSFVISVKPNDTKQERRFCLWVPATGLVIGGFTVTQAAE